MKGCQAKSAGNWFDSHYKLQAPVPPQVPPTHSNPHMPLDNDSLANNFVMASPLPCYHHVLRELCHNPPHDSTTMSMGDMTPPPVANALTLQSAAPLSASTRRSWSHVIVKEGDIQRLHIHLCLKDKRVERLETYIGERKKKVRAEQKSKAKFKAHIDGFRGVVPISNNQPQVVVNHKEEFENDLRDCLKDSHTRLPLSTKAFIFGDVLHDKGFMNGMLFKQSTTIMHIFYHDTVFTNHKVLAAMDERGDTLNYDAVEVLRDLEHSYWVSCGMFKGKRFKAILPSKTNLYCAAKGIKAVADGIVPFARFSTPSGEGIKFNVIHVVRLLIKADGLEEAAKHIPIEICSSADAATITKSVGALTQGLSMNDHGAISPYTRRPLCLIELRGTN
jgi:hypothetical protein